MLFLTYCGQSQWPHSLRRRSAAAHLLRLWVWIPPGAWLFVCCECCVLSGRGLCDGLITRPEESYQWWCVVCDLETSWMRRLWPTGGFCATPHPTPKKNLWRQCQNKYVTVLVNRCSTFLDNMSVSWTYEGETVATPLVLNTLRTGDADLRLYITTVQDGWRKSAFLTSAWFPTRSTRNYAIHGACLWMVLLTDVYRNVTSLWINDLW
jgi:hypothetical protein